MKKCIIPLFLIFQLAIIMAPSQAGAGRKGISIDLQGGQSLFLYKDYYALVVGIRDYDTWPALPKAVEDAKEVSWFLKQRSVTVRLMIDPDSRELKKVLNDLVREAGQEPDRGILFYYAGHGETQTQTDGTKLGWIIPRDCPPLRDDPKGFSNRAISMKAIETYSTQIRSRHVLMLFDASFSGDIFSLEPAVLKTMDEASRLPVRQYIMAGREGDVPPGESAFGDFLIKGLKGEADLVYDGYITGSELGKYLTERVARAARDRRKPQYGLIRNEDLAGGDFVFLLKEVRPTKGRLFVETDPGNARVRILNIRPVFEQGMELKPGKYHIEVSAEGYLVQKSWISLEAGEDKTIEISLTKIGHVMVNSLDMKFAFILPGGFTMGSSQHEPGSQDDEKAHRVTLTRGYYIQTTEVTAGQFRQFVEATGYKTEAEKGNGCWMRTDQGVWKQKKESNWNSPGSGERSGEMAESSRADSRPVTCISWHDAQAFIQWLSRKEGLSYGLPTEAEWENACRAGTRTPFSSGSCLPTSQANYGGVGPLFPGCQGAYRVNNRGPLMVESLDPNPWGLFDMHGNVSEWCQDWYGPYPEGHVADPKGPPSGKERVMRGGHWLADASGCRSAKRGCIWPNYAADVIGFRLVLRPQQ